MNISSSAELQKLLDSPVRLKLYFLKNLPMALLAGIRLDTYDLSKAKVSMPYKYLTKNPFNSIYFACQAMAAEFSTAVLCLQQIAKHDADISLLVVGLEADFVKKAGQRITFTSYDSGPLQNAIAACISEKKPQRITLSSVGTDPQGNTIAEFRITWSFKTRS